MSSPVLDLPEAAVVIQLGRAASADPADLGDLSGRATLVPREQAPESLRIRILVPRVDVGGGARVLFEHANRLHDRGHHVVVLAHFPPPDWFTVRASYRRVPVGLGLAEALDPCDLVVCGCWDQIASARGAEVAPVVHFEQGDFHLFEDLPDDYRRRVKNSLALADATTTVSARVGHVLAERYGIADAGVVHNAVDPQIFRSEGPRRQASSYLLCVGWDGSQFKGMSDVRELWARLRARHPDLNLVWVTPRQPLEPMGEVVVAPSQPQLAALYRGASAYLCASRYESFPLPPLEAMASGAPVVTTANVGVLEYARHGENALVVPIGDVNQMYSAVCQVLADPALAASLREGGLQTAASFSWDSIITNLEDRYREIAASEIARGDVAAWTRLLPTAVEAASGATARLELTMATSTAAEILVPVQRPAIDGHELASWEVIARRDTGVASVKVHAPHRVDERGCLPYQSGIDALNAEDPKAAFQIFSQHLRAATTRARRGAIAKWIALSLFEFREGAASLDLIRASLPAFPDNPDYTYLAAIIGASEGCVVDLDRARTNLALIGEGRRYDDWFVNPTRRLEERIAA